MCVGGERGGGSTVYLLCGMFCSGELFLTCCSHLRLSQTRTQVEVGQSHFSSALEAKHDFLNLTTHTVD